MREAVKRHWIFFIVQGSLMMLAGAFALVHLMRK
jgi:uncharacterized membrane protein HdeD (DUF308 family)